MTKENAITTLRELFENDNDLFIEAIEELDNWNGYLGDSRYYEMHELNEIYSTEDPLEIIARAF